MNSSHLFLLAVLTCILSAALVAGDRSFLRLSPDPSDLDEDVVHQHMSRLHDKCNRGHSLKEGNTVRSFRASQDSADGRMVYRLNLTTLQDSEVILSATFHFLLEKRSHPKPWFCKRFKRPACRSTAKLHSPSISLLLRSISSGPEVRSGSQGSLLGNVTFHPHRRGVWQMKDVTQVIKEARDRGQLLVSVEMDLGPLYRKQAEEVHSADHVPYLLLYADDQALAEPNSVAASLQRYDPFNEGAELHKPNSSAKMKGRVRRDSNLLSDLIQDNELPEVEYKPNGYRKDELWESDSYLALKPKFKAETKGGKRKTVNQPQVLSKAERTQLIKNDLTAKNLKDTLFASERRKNERRNEGTRHKGSADTRSPVLRFDEQTMRKARRRQWGDVQDRRCSRRNLRVDFEDIGWSEWVIAPKAFDAYYCAGTCGFPMPQVVRPSNHATIQSIVRAVGIIPGIPEPCCVPENMNPLAVLFQDESRNLVLKVYPNMSVQSCSCR